jgi:mRNA-degrading endonuclease toxin of MazEF toxin-antitoxin module
MSTDTLTREAALRTPREQPASQAAPAKKPVPGPPTAAMTLAAPLKCAALSPQTGSGKPEYTHRRGDIWFVDDAAGQHHPVGNETWSNRAAVVVSNDLMNRRSGFAEIVYLTESEKKQPSGTHVWVRLPDSYDALALCEQVHTVDASRLRRRKGQVPATDMTEIDGALLWALGIQAMLPRTHEEQDCEDSVAEAS